MSSTKKGKKWVCVTRAIKNVNHIKGVAPNIFPKGQAHTKVVPLETLMTLHSLAKPQEQVKHKELGSVLAESKIPIPKIRRGDAVGPGGTIVAGPLFTGTLYFVQI